MPTVNVTSLVGLMTKEALVQMQWTDERGEHKIQMTAEEAGDLSMNLLQDAQVAVSDLFITHFFLERFHVEMDKVGMILQDFRDFRAQRADRTDRVSEHADGEEGGEG